VQAGSSHLSSRRASFFCACHSSRRAMTGFTLPRARPRRQSPPARGRLPVSLASDERNPPASNSVLAARTRCVTDAATGPATCRGAERVSPAPAIPRGVPRRGLTRFARVGAGVRRFPFLERSTGSGFGRKKTAELQHRAWSHQK
jgi:hypothetical protein